MARLDAVEFPGLPKRRDCLAWSEDGELAIAVGELVYVLTPKQPPIRGESNETPWHRTQFNAGTFSQSEWPEITVDSMLDMYSASIGREQAAAEVVSLQWSPPGVAQGFRCALAVLTTNYLLSLWTADLDYTVETKWVRQCVINSYISNDLPPIVAMGWAPILDIDRLSGNEDVVPSHRAPLVWRYYFAVVLQDMQLQAMEITTPKRTQQIGTITTCASSTFPDAAISANKGRQSSYDSLVRRDAPALGTSLHGVEWSRWRYPSRNLPAESMIFARAFNEDVQCPINAGVEGIMGMSQACKSEESSDVRKANDTDSVWNGPCMATEVSTLCENEEEAMFICLTTHEYTFEVYRFGIEKSGRLASWMWKPSAGPSYLDDQVNKLKHVYSEKLRVHGEVDVRAWGIASCGQYLALCVTLHPAHMLQYVVPSNVSTHVLFSHSSMEAMNTSGISSEGPAKFQFPGVTSTAAEKNDFEAHLGPLPSCIPPHASNLSSVRMNAQLTFTTLIASFLRSDSAISWLAHIDAILATYSNAASSIPEISPLLTAIQTARSQCSTDPDDPSFISKVALTKLVNEFISTRAVLESSASPSNPVRILEYCPTASCHAPVFWSPSLGASCSAGHRQTRCSLTALAMLNPYTIKRCAACARAYLEETRLEAYYADAVASRAITEKQCESNGSDKVEEEDGVAWLLQAVTCVYCGGKFTRYV